MLPRLFNRRYFPDLTDESFGEDFMSDIGESLRGVNIPSVNVADEENEYRIEVAAPGLEKNDFNVQVNDNTLEISSEQKHEDEDKKRNFVRKEFSYTSFKRAFTLPEGVDSENIKAEHKNGVLYVHLPKKEETKEKPSRKIEIK